MTIACRRCLTYGDPKPMAAHFRAHAAKGEAIPDVPLEPPVYGDADPNVRIGMAIVYAKAAERRFHRSAEQVAAEKFAWMELNAQGKPPRTEEALEAAGRMRLERRQGVLSD